MNNITNNKTKRNNSSMKKLFLITLLASTSVFAQTSANTVKVSPAVSPTQTKDSTNKNLPENGRAEVELGMKHLKGIGMKKNPQEAIKLFTAAANKGNIDGFYSIGAVFYNGDGVKQNYGEALKWLTMASNKGHTSAQVLLAEMYYNGTGVKQNYGEALRLSKLAVEKNIPDSQYLLGKMYYFGQGVKANSQEAFKWYELAAKSGYAEARTGLGVIYLDAYASTKNIAHYNNAVKMLKLAASQNEPVAKAWVQKNIKK